ncbi:hypothetical protein LMH87_003322 [Akanthomyces muscarius]|uniref:Uncharacterized protein n=1 Tax=Akanthomyces muscarius TaxID=2231603 RepID=A0A9W8Q1J9_AKAMU|nr:hypothetical protein LMH87_003322 [Akanthomyces muscarius]KAJ4144440.1 hypothetical protein LMH87_003322 [Akanthomyces muscarius]
MSGTNAVNKVTKQRWTSKRTRNQFSVLLEYAITASPAVSPSDKGQELAAGMQTAAENEPIESLLRLQTNEANPPPSDPAPSSTVTNATIADDTAQDPNEMYDGDTRDAGAASVPRLFDYTDLTILSDDSDQDAAVDLPVVRAAAHDEPLVSPEAESSMDGYLDAIAPLETKAERFSTPKRPRTGIHVTNTGVRREIIFIESSDEGESGDEDAYSPISRLTLAEASFDVPSSERHGTSAEDIYSPAQVAPFDGTDNESAENGSSFDTSASESHATRSTLENASFDMPPSKPLATSVGHIRSPKSRQATPLVSSIHPSAESESSGDNIPLAVLRKEASFRVPTVVPNESSEDNIPLATLRKEASSRVPTLVPQVISEDICSSTRTQTTTFLNNHKVSADNESSEDNVPLSVLRKNRLGNKRRLSDDEETEFAIVNRPTPAVRRSTTTRSQTKAFDSDAFDAMIYRQSERQPPFGVSVPRPTAASSAGPRDSRVFVHANPAIHAPVVRTEKWLKDKAREIRSRPNRKKWFGRPAKRLRWLYNKQMEDKMKRQTQNNGSAGRKMRQDPQPAGYKRVMDFGDVPQDRLPPVVLNNPAWVKACKWTRQMRDEDVALSREVEHRTHITWQHYQDVLQEDD